MNPEILKKLIAAEKERAMWAQHEKRVALERAEMARDWKRRGLL